jgi:hypothetical protein
MPCRCLKFVRPLDARHFNFVRPTLKFHAAMDSEFSSFCMESLHKIVASGTPGRTLTESLIVITRSRLTAEFIEFVLVVYAEL